MIPIPDPFPPLPALPILTGSAEEQRLTDSILQKIHAQRPDLFVRLAEREALSRPPTQEEEAEHLATANEIIALISDLMTDSDKTITLHAFIYYEARRRSRLMFGMTL